MSQAQEQRRKEWFESQGQAMFEPTFERLRKQEAEFKALPIDSEERKTKEQQYNKDVEAASEEYGKCF
ncbi:MAG: hypothetical protein BGN93_03555 [Acinetobacter sp. 39-4]|nr:MAG: hypothetical protein BGN93_03555 [Acinetobacter sp. 39-4]